jgi:OTU domain-containing protein 6
MVKKNKIKKVLSPSHSNTPEEPPTVQDDGLMDDLLAELDSRDQTVQHESATVLMEMQDNQENLFADKAQSATKKQDSKSRHEARQVSICSRLLHNHKLTLSRRERQRP